jgi:hypothetical protein
MTGPQPTPAIDYSTWTPYQRYLKRQTDRIYAKGGTDEDVQRYVHGMAFANQPPDYQGPGFLQGSAQHVLQGLGVGGADEALGTLAGIVQLKGPWSERGQKGRDAFRRDLAAYEGEYGAGSARTFELLGALLPMVLSGGAAAPAEAAAGGGLLPTAAKAFTMKNLAIGGGIGAAAGFNSAEGGLSERTTAALGSGAAGVVLGPLLHVGSNLLGAAAGGAVRRAFIPMAERLGTTVEKLGPTIQRYSDGLVDVLKKLPGSPARIARQALAMSNTRDALTVEQMVQEVRLRASQGMPVTLADVVGPHGLTLAKTVQQFQGPQQRAYTDMLMEKLGPQSLRLIRGLSRMTRGGFDNAYQLADDLKASYKVAGQQLYDAAYEQTARMPEEAKRALTSEFTGRQWRAAWEWGRMTAGAEDQAGIGHGLAVPQLPEEATMIGNLKDVPVRALDYMKRGLDYFRRNQGKEGVPVLSERQFEAMGQELKGMLAGVDADVPTYGRARQISEGYFHDTEAINEGRTTFPNSAPDVIRAKLAASHNPDLWRAGAIQSLADLTAAGGDATSIMGRSLHGAPNVMAERIKALFPTEDGARMFQDMVGAEGEQAAWARRMQRTPPNIQSAAKRLVGQPNVSIRVPLSNVRIGRQVPVNVQKATQIANEVTNLFAEDDPTKIEAILHGLEGIHDNLNLFPGRQDRLIGLARAVPRAAQASLLVGAEQKP